MQDAGQALKRKRGLTAAFALIALAAMLERFGRSVAVDDKVCSVASGHTSDRMSIRIEVAARVSGRRAWTVEQKAAMLRDAFGPAGLVRASRHPAWPRCA